METKDKKRIKDLLEDPEYSEVKEAIINGDWDRFWNSLFNMPVPPAKKLDISSGVQGIYWHEYWPAMFLTMFAELNIDCGLKSIPAHAFTYSTIEYIKIPSCVTYIGQKAFFGCNELRNIEIPDSVTKIDRDAFTALGNIDPRNIILPERFNGTDLKSIGIYDYIDNLRFI